MNVIQFNLFKQESQVRMENCFSFSFVFAQEGVVYGMQQAVGHVEKKRGCLCYDKNNEVEFTRREMTKFAGTPPAPHRIARCEINNGT